MVFDERIYWWYFVPGALIFLPVMLRRNFFLNSFLLSFSRIFTLGFGTHLFFSLYHMLIIRLVPRKSIAFLDYRLRKELRRRDFKIWNTTKVFDYFLEKTEGWELKRIRRYSSLLSFLGCVIVACGFGIISVIINKTDFLMKYYILFSIFAVLNFSVVWEMLGNCEMLLIKSNLVSIVTVTKKKKLLW